MSDAENHLEARGVSIGYGDTLIVNDLELSIPPKGFTALLGPNGSGKSTILRTLAGLHPIKQGSLLLDGVPIAKMPRKSLARRIGLLAQGAVAPEGLRVIDLVRQGRYPHRAVFSAWTESDEVAVQEALELTSLASLKDRHLDVLSGGQRQRAWIAMVLAQSTPILLLDEPTTYLDLAHQVDLMTLLRRLVNERRMTIVAVLHDLNQAARWADHLVMLKQGRIAIQGATVDVFRGEHIADVFGVEVTVLHDPSSGSPFCIPQHTQTQNE